MQNQIDKDTVDLFIMAAKEVTATVETVSKNAEALNEALKAATGNEKVILSEPNNISSELFSVFKSNPNVITDPDKEQLATVKIGITDAFCGIAATGSVCVSVAKNLTSPASMLTRKHIVIVDGRTIVPRPRDVFSDVFLNDKRISNSFSIITGPSATADMGPLVRGVHGPGKIHIIILE